MTRLEIVSPAKSSTASDEPNQLREAKLQRTKFVILSEAEGPAFFSSHYASSGNRADHLAREQS
jgi:hypothetical protein